MNDYQIISPMNNSLNIIDIKELSNVVEKKLQYTLIDEMGDSKNMVQEYMDPTNNKNAFYLFYGEEKIVILIDKKEKKLFESKTKLKLQVIK